jgi:hypothetical protein
MINISVSDVIACPIYRFRQPFRGQATRVQCDLRIVKISFILSDPEELSCSVQFVEEEEAMSY